MTRCRVTEELNAHESNDTHEYRYQNLITEYILEEILTNADKLLPLIATDSEEEAKAIVDLYQSLPMKNGERPAFGLGKVESRAWDLIETYINNQHIRDEVENMI